GEGARDRRAEPVARPDHQADASLRPRPGRARRPGPGTAQAAETIIVNLFSEARPDPIRWDRPARQTEPGAAHAASPLVRPTGVQHNQCASSAQANPN